MAAVASLRADEIDDLWRAYGYYLMRFATVLVGPHEAEDISTEAFVRAAPAALLPSTRDPRAYLFGAVANRARSFRRSRERRWRRDLAAVGPAAVHPADDFGHVRRAVAHLTLAQRTVVYFAYWEDLPEREIAELLGTSPSTVHRTLARAKSILRKALT